LSSLLRLLQQGVPIAIKVSASITPDATPGSAVHEFVYPALLAGVRRSGYTCRGFGAQPPILTRETTRFAASEGDPLRRILFTASVVAAAALTPALAVQPSSAQGLGQSAIRVHALILGQNYPVTGLGASVADCSGGRAVARVTTGMDGTATAQVPVGCYRVAVTTIPAGCSLDGAPAVQVTALPVATPEATFHVRCA
jgi:hypothetical protein